MSDQNEARKGGLRSASAWREAFQLIKENRARLSIGLAIMVVNRLSGFVLPASSKYLLDEAIGNARYELITWITLAVVAATIVQAVTSFSLTQVVSLAAQRTIMLMRMRVQRHVTRLPVSFFADRKTGQLISQIIEDPIGIRNLIGTGVIQLIGGAFTAIVAAAILFYLNLTMTLWMILILVAFGVVLGGAFRYLRPIFRKRNKIKSEVSGRLGETLGGIQIVKAYRMEEREHNAFQEGVEKIYEMIVKSITGIAGVSAFGTITIGAIGVVILVVGGRSIQAGAMTIGDFVMFVFLAGLLSAPIIQMANIGTQISEALAGLDRVRDLMTRETEDSADQNREALGEIGGEVTFENVYFQYDRDEDVLFDVSFKAPAGSTTALVGSSGAGKSTIANLVMAFNRPRLGRVLIDGRDLNTIKISEYRNVLGVVLQDNFLFDGTIADNIRFARPDATKEEIEEAGRVANCEEFVSSFRDRYDTVIGERGVKLSGGQRQRVAIARALIANPRILVLDEATSSLDTKSERLIQAGIERLRSGRTTFVIAHRLSTIRSADQILVIEDGRILEAGSHAELLAADGRYRELHDEQHAWEEDVFVNPGEENYARQPGL